jgi:hypothetical protein
MMLINSRVHDNRADSGGSAVRQGTRPMTLTGVWGACAHLRSLGQSRKAEKISVRPVLSVRGTGVVKARPTQSSTPSAAP